MKSASNPTFCRCAVFFIYFHRNAKKLPSPFYSLFLCLLQIDLKQIKAVFFQKYQKTLAKFIEQDTSGDYKRILVGIVGYDW